MIDLRAEAIDLRAEVTDLGAFDDDQRRPWVDLPGDEIDHHRILSD